MTNQERPPVLTEGTDEVADIMVQCPMPEHRGDGPQRMGDFIQTEVGKRVLGPVIENYGQLKDMGIDREKAASMAFAGFAVKDEQGNLVKAVQEEAPRQTEISNTGLDLKKKVAPQS